MITVHPHSRGEHLAALAAVCGLIGSSPLAWGTHLQKYQAHNNLRFIPTRVGNTRRQAHRPRPVAVHPHSRGEHVNQFRQEFLCDGSSPLAWGTPLLRVFANCPRRFIPTRVGNTSSGRTTTPLDAVHPHSRGEHKPIMKPCSTNDGSSPLAWGTPLRRSCR